MPTNIVMKYNIKLNIIKHVQKKKKFMNLDVKNRLSDYFTRFLNYNRCFKPIYKTTAREKKLF